MSVHKKFYADAGVRKAFVGADLDFRNAREIPSSPCTKLRSCLMIHDVNNSRWTLRQFDAVMARRVSGTKVFCLYIRISLDSTRNEQRSPGLSLIFIPPANAEDPKNCFKMAEWQLIYLFPIRSLTPIN